MSFHDDLGAWRWKTDKHNCPVCNNAPMPEGMIDLAELPASWINAMPVECMKYACHLTAKYHGIELFDLTEAELLNIMRDVCLCAKVLKRVTDAIKINYEIHGNTEPHLHIHLYPRFVDDPFPGQAINYNQKSASIYAPGEYEDFVARMRKELMPKS